mmetsp:Transcript_21406/g.70919  ORF Transcript_21406/g.70919 Transcript_21406/m.70919 type:complete len:109 (+) Transcript_21406:213-539(+)
MLFMVVGYHVLSLWHWYKLGFTKYWKSLWTVIDWVNFVLFYVAFGLRYGALLNAKVCSPVNIIRPETLTACLQSANFPPADNEFVYYAPAANMVSMVCAHRLLTLCCS